MLMVALGTGIAPMRAFIEAHDGHFLGDVGIFDPRSKMDGRHSEDQKHDQKRSLVNLESENPSTYVAIHGQTRMLSRVMGYVMK